MCCRGCCFDSTVRLNKAQMSSEKTIKSKLLKNFTFPGFPRLPPVQRDLSCTERGLLFPHLLHQAVHTFNWLTDGISQTKVTKGSDLIFEIQYPFSLQTETVYVESHGCVTALQGSTVGASMRKMFFGFLLLHKRITHSPPHSFWLSAVSSGFLANLRACYYNGSM